MHPIARLPRPEDSLDADDLNLLSTFHFVGAGLDFLASPYLLRLFAHMHSALINPSFFPNQKQLPSEAIERLHLMLERDLERDMWICLFMGLLLAASVILNILSGIYLRKRKHRTFSLVVAGMNCLGFPLGTILGVFTIIVLDRQSVKELYEAHR